MAKSLVNALLCSAASRRSKTRRGEMIRSVTFGETREDLLTNHPSRRSRSGPVLRSGLFARLLLRVTMLTRPFGHMSTYVIRRGHRGKISCKCSTVFGGISKVEDSPRRDDSLCNIRGDSRRLVNQSPFETQPVWTSASIWAFCAAAPPGDDVD